MSLVTANNLFKDGQRVHVALIRVGMVIILSSWNPTIFPYQQLSLYMTEIKLTGPFNFNQSIHLEW